MYGVVGVAAGGSRFCLDFVTRSYLLRPVVSVRSSASSLWTSFGIQSFMHRVQRTPLRAHRRRRSQVPTEAAFVDVVVHLHSAICLLYFVDTFPNDSLKKELPSHPIAGSVHIQWSSSSTS